jgi:hypothetical protein
MDIQLDTVNIVHNRDANRFEAYAGETLTGIIEYQLAKQNMIFHHTEVFPEFEGKGIAGKLAQVALNYARDNDFKIQAVCPYIVTYIKRHKEYQPITWGYF